MVTLNTQQALTSVIIPSAGRGRSVDQQPMLKRCLDSLSCLQPAPLEVLVVIGDEYEGPPVETLSNMAVEVLHRGPGPFDFSQAVNAGVLRSSGEQSLVLNDDTETAETDWLGHLASHLQDPTVAAVGATLLYPDATIQHIGIEFDKGEPIHSFRGQNLADVPPDKSGVPHAVHAVTGACLLIRRSSFLAVGGMSHTFPISYGDVDLCLRLQRCGYRVLLDPTVRLTHHESSSRPKVIQRWEQERFIQRWGPDPHVLVQAHTAHPNPDSTAAPAMHQPGADADTQASLTPSSTQALHLTERYMAQAVQLEQLRLQKKNLARALADREETLREWKNRVSERDAYIAEHDARIAERDQQIAERNTRIAERDARIAERDQQIAERDTRIAERDTRIAELEAKNLHLHEELARPAIIRLARRLFRGPIRRPRRDE